MCADWKDRRLWFVWAINFLPTNQRINQIKSNSNPSQSEQTAGTSSLPLSRPLLLTRCGGSYFLGGRCLCGALLLCFLSIMLSMLVCGVLRSGVEGCFGLGGEKMHYSFAPFRRRVCQRARERERPCAKERQRKKCFGAVFPFFDHSTSFPFLCSIFLIFLSVRLLRSGHGF